MKTMSGRSAISAKRASLWARLRRNLLYSAMGIGGLAGVSIHAALFSQDFSSYPDGPVSQYVNATSPDSHQWNAIGTSGAGTTVSVANGALQYTRGTANVGSFSRTTDFSPEPPAIIYTFVLTVSGNTVAQTSAATWQVGSGFGTANAAESPGVVHSRFAINFTTTDGTFQFHVIGGADSGNLSGSQNVTWVINNSGGTLSYQAPNGQVGTVGNDAWDLWAGSTIVFDEVAAETASRVLTDLKFAFTVGSGTVTMDNFNIEAVPEPVNVALAIFGGIGAGVWGVRRWCASRA